MGTAHVSAKATRWASLDVRLYGMNAEVPPSSVGCPWPLMAAGTAWFVSVQLNPPMPPSRMAFALLTVTVPDLCCPLKSCLDSETGMGQTI